MTLTYYGALSTSKVEFQREPLTGQQYCLANIKLLPLENNEIGNLILTCDQEGSAENNLLKATLKFVQKEKKYHMDSNETLKIHVDGAPLAVEVINSFQDPQNAVSHYAMAMPSGGSMMLGSVTEITKRSMSFFLSMDSLSKMMTAKKVVFEISSSSSKDAKKAILLELGMEEKPFLQEFKNTCLNKKSLN